MLAGSDGLHTLSDEAMAEVLGQNAELEAAPLAVRLVQAVLDVQQPKQDNTTAAILKPPADWLIASFDFAPPEASAQEEEKADLTQRLVPRVSRPSSPAGGPPEAAL